MGSSEQEVSDCQRFSKYPAGPPPDPVEKLANEVEAHNDEIIKTVGINPEKKVAALLSTDVMDFGQSIKDSKPKEPDLEKEGYKAIPEFQKRFKEGGTAYAEEFHRQFDSRMNHVFKVGKTNNLKPDEMFCSMISQSYPPTLDMTRRCGIAIGRVADQLPSH